MTYPAQLIVLEYLGSTAYFLANPKLVTIGSILLLLQSNNCQLLSLQQIPHKFLANQYAVALVVIRFHSIQLAYLVAWLLPPTYSPLPPPLKLDGFVVCFSGSFGGFTKFRIHNKRQTSESTLFRFLSFVVNLQIVWSCRNHYPPELLMQLLTLLHSMLLPRVVLRQFT